MEEMKRCAKEVRVYQTICNIENKAQKELGIGLMLLVDISIPCVYKYLYDNGNKDHDMTVMVV